MSQDKWRFWIYNSCDETDPISVSSISVETISGVSYLRANLSTPFDTDAYLVGDDVILSGFSDPDYNVTTFIKQINSPLQIVFGIRETVAGGSVGEVTFYPRREVTPYNFLDASYKWEKANDGAYFRKKLSGTLLFKNGKNNTDYTYFYENIFGACCPIKFIIEKYCSGGWSRDWKGSFSFTDVKWDNYKCIVEVEPEPDDEYKCLLDNYEIEQNFIEVPNEVTANYLSNLTYDYIVVEGCSVFGYPTPAGYGVFAQYQPGSPTPPNCDDWWRIYAKEIRVTRCIAGQANPPLGVGWVLDNNDCLVSGTSTYTRPYAGVIYTDVEVTQAACSGTDPVSPGPNFVLIYDNCGVSDLAYWFDNGAPDEYTHCRTLEDTLLYFAQAACPKINRIVSDFFEINPAGDAPGYVAGENYVVANNGGPWTAPQGDATNQLSNILVSAKSDIKLPAATEPATRAITTFKTLLDNLWSMFMVRWFIDANFNLRLEHISYFEQGTTINTTTAPDDEYNANKEKWEYKKDEMPERQTYSWMEAFSVDFVGAPITYTGGCIKKNKEEKYSVSNITTDIQYIRDMIDAATPDKIADDGFVFLVCDSDNNIIHEHGELTGYSQQNGHLSWANLHINYHRYNGVVNDMQVNYAEVDPFTLRRTKLQKNIKIKDCCRTFNPQQTTVVTLLGSGLIDSAEFSFRTNITTMEILHIDV